MANLRNNPFGSSFLKRRCASPGFTESQSPHFIHRPNSWFRLLAGVLLGLTGLVFTWLSLPGLAQTDPPLATNDSYILAEDTVLSVSGTGVLSNDNDPDGDPLSATVTVSPTHGTLLFNSNGSFTYTPALNFAGQDSFNYRVEDGTGGTATGVVTLTVNPANDPPAAGQAKTLYDGALGTLPTAQSFSYSAIPGTSIQTIAGGLTTLDTTPSRFDYAGYFHDTTPLNRNSGYTLRFAVQVVTESHVASSDYDGDGLADRAGFSVTALSSDNFGIELGFWTNRVWAQDDGLAEPPPASITRTLFTQAEGVPFNTTSLITYELTISGMAYSLTAGGTEVLSGSLRNYTTLPLPAGAVYQTPNLIFVGDNTPSAQTQVRLGYVSVITNMILPDQATTPATDLPVPGLGVFDLDGGSGQETLTLTANSGLLTVSTTAPGGVSPANISGNGAATLVMTGTLNQLNQTLSQSPTFLTYRSLPAFTGVDTVTLTLNDQGYTGGGSLTASRSFNILVSAPELSLVKEVSNLSPRPGERITYTLTIVNNGNQDATSGVVSDTLPAGLSLAGPVTLSPAGAGTIGSPPTLVSGLTVTAGQKVTVTLPVTVSSGLEHGDRITNTATVSSAEVVTPAAGTAVAVVSNPVDLQLSKTVTPSGPVLPGQPITYTLTFSNNGPGIARGVVIIDLVPGQVSNLSYNSGGSTLTPTGSASYTWQVADLASGQGGVITLTGSINAGLGAATTFTNTASITTSSPETEASDNVSNVNLAVILPQIQFQRAKYNVDENRGRAVITVTVSPSPFVTTSVVITSSDGTASRLSDYNAISQTLILKPGLRRITTTIAITDDLVFEEAETVNLRLNNPVQATLGTRATAALLILDNEPAPAAKVVYLPLLVKNGP